MRRKMTEEQIADFVRDMAATGCEILAVGDDSYVVADAHLPDDVYATIAPEIERISQKYGQRDHLREQIAAYLRSIGRIYPASGPH
ncbi:UNVERIFIED_ORG: hypothetical protein LHK14_22950 (plasmid) [Roseateles sp. XES5]|nr:hypothetical protein [Roseateles sp. XES5]